MNKEIIKQVEKETDKGKEIVEAEMRFIKDLASGKIYEELDC